MFNNSKFFSFLEKMDENKEIRISSFKNPKLIGVRLLRHDVIVLCFSKDNTLEAFTAAELKEKIKFYALSILSPNVKAVILKEGERVSYFSDENLMEFDQINFDVKKDFYVVNHSSISEKKEIIEDLEQWYFIDEYMEKLIFKTKDSSYILTKGKKLELILKKIDNLSMSETTYFFSNLETLSKTVKPPVKTMIKLLVKESKDA